MNKKVRDVDRIKAMPRSSVITWADKKVMMYVLIERVKSGHITFTISDPKEQGRLLADHMERLEERARRVVLSFITSMMIQARKGE